MSNSNAQLLQQKTRKPGDVKRRERRSTSASDDGRSGNGRGRMSNDCLGSGSTMRTWEEAELQTSLEVANRLLLLKKKTPTV